MIIPSYFGSLADSTNLQALIDTNLTELAGESVWRSMLREGLPQASLSFETVIGRSRIEAAASIVDPDAPAPLRSRKGLEMLTGRIPTMKEKFRMQQADMRALMALQENPRFQNEAGVKRIIDTLFDSVKTAATAGDKRVDIMLLQGMSTFLVDLSATGNPDGVAYGTVPLLARQYQRQGVPVVWTDLQNATPIDDIDNYIEAIYGSKGRRFGRLRMSRDLWLVFKRTKQVQDRLKAFFNIGKANGTYAPTLAHVNEMFEAEGWPPIQIVNNQIGIEEDGKITPFKPFNTDNVVFTPAGILGELQNAFPMEKLKPVTGKTYADFGPTLVGKWLEDDPLVEFTAMEMNAFPALTEIDAIYILRTNVVQATYSFTNEDTILS